MKYLITLLRVLAKAFRTIVDRLPDNKDDCPPVMHSRHSKDAHDLLAQHLNESEEMRVAYRQSRIEVEDFLRRVDADVLCPRCLGLGTEEDGKTACIACENTGIVPLSDGTYGTYV